MTIVAVAWLASSGLFMAFVLADDLLRRRAVRRDDAADVPGVIDLGEVRR